VEIPDSFAISDIVAYWYPFSAKILVAASIIIFFFESFLARSVIDFTKTFLVKNVTFEFIFNLVPGCNRVKREKVHGDCNVKTGHFYFALTNHIKFLQFVEPCAIRKLFVR